MRTIKAYMDGALGSRGAALLAPYNDADTTGLFLIPPDELRALCRRALRAGIQMETHAIGDRANRQVLDIYAQVFREISSAQRRVRDPRWRTEHAQLLHPGDIPRFAKLRVGGDRLHAAVTRHQRFAFCTAPTGAGTPGRRICVAVAAGHRCRARRRFRCPG